MNDTMPPASERRIWAAVPFKGPVGSKRRLAGLLDASERQRLSLAMLAGVLDVLLNSARIERVLLLTPSPSDAAWPEHDRLTVVEEPRAANGTAAVGSLNAALRHAQHVAQAGGADGLLIVPADLPLIGLSDLEAMLEAGDSASVVIAPDRAAQGTNALLLVPPLALEPGFGEGSYVRHRLQAEQAGLSVAVLERTGLKLDLDTPADVAVLLAGRHTDPAATLLRELCVERRLDRSAPLQARSTTI